MRADASHVVVRPLLGLKASYGIQCSRYIYWAMTPTTSSISFNADGSLDVIKAVVFAHLVHSDNNLGSNTKGRKDTRRGLSVFFLFTSTIVTRICSPFGDEAINLSPSLSHFPPASVSLSFSPGRCKDGHACFSVSASTYPNSACKF